jgi:hypothetical protein
MTCDIRGGCKICPGMWIAAALLAIMAVQSLLSRYNESTKSEQVKAVSTMEHTPAVPQAKN